MAKDKEGKIECLKEKKKMAVLAVKGGHFLSCSCVFSQPLCSIRCFMLVNFSFLSCKLNVFTRESPLLQ